MVDESKAEDAGHRLEEAEQHLEEEIHDLERKQQEMEDAQDGPNRLTVPPDVEGPGPHQPGLG